MCIQEKYKYKGWNNCLRLYNKEVELIITTDVGPRIIRYGFIEEQNLFREFEEQVGKTGGNDYRLYGGTRFWHGPEASPRCYYPDNDTVIYKIDGKKVTLTQNIETTTGMQKEVTVNLNSEDNSVNIVYRVYNRNLWDIKFAPWILSIMNLAGCGIVPQEPFKTWEEKLAPARPLVLWNYTTMNDPRWIWGEKYIQLKQDPSAKTRQKLGILNTLGWAAYYLNSQIFIKRYPYNPNKEYTDFGVNTEIYTDKDIFEVETLGNFTSISPEGYTEHKENWYIFKSEININNNLIDTRLLSLIETTKMP
jgi:hypothetical protein